MTITTKRTKTATEGINITSTFEGQRWDLIEVSRYDNDGKLIDTETYNEEQIKHIHELTEVKYK